MPDETAIASVHALIGDAGFERLIRAFYRRIPTDDLLGSMYPSEDLEGSEHRLRSFLIFRFGGPDHYLTERGHPQLRMRHAPFAIGQAARDRWISLMDDAFQDANLPDEATVIMRPFLHEVATFLINRNSQPSIVS